MMDPRTGAHVDSKLLAAYLDRTLTDSISSDVEQHLAGCPQCRADLLDVTRVIRAHRARTRVRPFVYLTGVAAAVVLIVVAVVGTGSRPTGEATDIVRGSTDEGVLRLSVQTPMDGDIVTNPGAVLRWASAGASVFYRVTVTDIEGDEVWSGMTGDSSIALSDVQGLARAGRYFWFVDALLPDGRSATTGVHQFEVAF